MSEGSRKDIHAARAGLWGLGLLGATLVWSEFALRSMDGLAPNDAMLRLTETVGFAMIPICIVAAAGLIALAVTRRLRPVLWTATAALIIFAGIVEVGRRHAIQHPLHQAALNATVDRALADCKDAWGTRESEIVRCAIGKVAQSAPLSRDIVAARVREVAAKSGLLTAEIKKEERPLKDDMEPRRAAFAGEMCPLSSPDAWAACFKAKQAEVSKSGCSPEFPATPATMRRCFEPLWLEIERVMYVAAAQAGTCDGAVKIVEEKGADLARDRDELVATTLKERMRQFKNTCAQYLGGTYVPAGLPSAKKQAADGCKTRNEYLRMEPPVVPGKCLHVLDEPASPRPKPAAARAEGCKTAEEYRRTKPMFIPDECAYVVGLDNPLATGQPDYTEGPRPGVVWADRLPAPPKPGFFARIFDGDADLPEYERCLRQLVKDAKTSEAAKIGERFCQERHKPGLFDRLFK